MEPIMSLVVLLRACLKNLWSKTLATLLFFSPLLQAREFPTERRDQPWLIHSLAAEAGLQGKNIFNVAFSQPPTQPLDAKVYLASADGLYVGDGLTWRKFTQANGLPSDFVRCVLVTRSGQLWVGTDKGAGTFDGAHFNTHGSEAGLAGPSVRRIVEDLDGALWFCSDNWPRAGQPGGLASYRDGVWHSFSASEGLVGGQALNYFRDAAGQQYAVTQNGLAAFEQGRWQEVRLPLAPPRDGGGTGSLAEAPKIGLLYSNGREVALQNGNRWLPQAKDLNHENGICATADGQLLSCGESSLGHRAIMSWTSNRWQVASAEFPIGARQVEDVREAPDGSIWVVGLDCLIRWERRGSEWREWSPAPLPEQVDDQGGVWFSRNRPEKLIEQPIRFLKESWIGFDNDYLGGFQERNLKIWVWTDKMLWNWTKGNNRETPVSEIGFRTFDRALMDGREMLYAVGFGPEGELAVADLVLGRWHAVKVPKLQNVEIVSSCDDPNIGIWLLLRHKSEAQYSLQHIRPDANRSFAVPSSGGALSTPNLKVAFDGTCWLYGDGGALKLKPGTTELWQPFSGLPGRQVLDIQNRADGLWMACGSALGGRNALAHLSGTNLTIHPTDVLLSFGHAAQGELLYGSKGKFYRVPNEQPAEVIEVNLPTQDSIYSVIKEAGRTFWLGTGNRAFRFQPDPTPPLTEAACATPTVVAGSVMMVDLWGRRPFQSLRERQDFHFTWRVDGGAWAPFQRIHKLPLNTAAIPPGRHTLEIRARDTSLVSDPAGTSLAFTVLPKPMQNRAWFRPLVGLFVLGFGLLAIRLVQAERKLADYGQNLEQMVQERTATERNLFDQERSYRLLFEANPHPMWVYDQATYAFLAVNEAALKIYGYSREEFARMTLRDILPAGEVSAALITLTDLPPKPTHIGISRLRKKDGTVFLADIYSTALNDQFGRAARLGTSIDLNDRGHLEEQLQQLHQLGSISSPPSNSGSPPV